MTMVFAGWTKINVPIMQMLADRVEPKGLVSDAREMVRRGNIPPGCWKSVCSSHDHSDDNLPATIFFKNEGGEFALKGYYPAGSSRREITNMPNGKIAHVYFIDMCGEQISVDVDAIPEGMFHYESGYKVAYSFIYVDGYLISYKVTLCDCGTKKSQNTSRRFEILRIWEYLLPEE